ncbi:MAG TPA: heme lyase CcmF/NrfE family subunit, partial [Spongiibacteraceae bacterium]|nr:heme lyase CcmF/NrfE family subunit [Spongiibacteraceae bacterium]
TLLPVAYKFAATWGNHEGSLLLWILILAGWIWAVANFGRSLPLDMQARVLSVLGVVATGFLLFSLFTSNPFARLLPLPPSEGRDLNPLLQDPGLVMHPPLLYIGYVGFSVAFAFAVAALWSGRLDAAWARWTRPWTNVAWLFLTLGIALGSWWAYYELGWGGWWFWDPVENASFMPWLAGTALIHSLAVTEKRGLFKSWTVLLAIFAFSLSLLGTFLVRSGVLTSVHSFAADPTRGIFILAFLALIVGGSLTLYALRAPRLTGTASYALVSREVLLLVNNVLLVVATLTVLLGTLFPMVVDALGGGKYSVGPPYFNAVFVPLMAVLMVFMGIGPNARWQKTGASLLARRLWPAALASVIIGLAFPVAYGGGYEPGAALAVCFAMWLLLSMLADLRERRWRLNTSYAGMLIAHLGLAVCVVGIGITSNYSAERDVRMAPGDSQALAGYRFEFLGVRHHEGPNFISDQGVLKVYRDDRQIAELYPEKRRYLSQRGQAMTEAAIDAGLFRDLYVALGEPLGDGAWAVRLHYKPFVRWIWLGALLMALGAGVAVCDKRYRRVRQTRTAALAGLGAGAS